MSILCKIGIHRWEIVQVAKFEMECGSAVIEGDKCQRCGKLKDAWGDILVGLPHPEQWRPYDEIPDLKAD